MTIESLKKNILTFKIVICIIINFLKLRNLHNSIMSSNLVNKLSLIKDLTKMSYDVITFNFVSVIFHGLPLYMKFKKLIRKFKKVNVKVSDNTN